MIERTVHMIHSCLHDAMKTHNMEYSYGRRGLRKSFPKFRVPLKEVLDRVYRNKDLLSNQELWDNAVLTFRALHLFRLRCGLQHRVLFPMIFLNGSV